MKKILAISSSGGHWIQLNRLRTAFEGNSVIYASTDPSLSQTINEKFYSLKDANISDKFSLIVLACQVFFLLLKERPDIVISTGAAPGFFALFFGKLLGKKTIWVDSIANAKEISLTGKKVKHFADIYITQWKHLAKDSDNLIYVGQVI